MVHLFIFHRDLRLYDNTTLIHIIKEKQNCIPIFIFPPEQINPKKNKYFSNNSVQFMIESLHELSNNIQDYKFLSFHFLYSPLNNFRKRTSLEIKVRLPPTDDIICCRYSKLGSGS